MKTAATAPTTRPRCGPRCEKHTTRPVFSNSRPDTYIKMGAAWAHQNHALDSARAGSTRTAGSSTRARPRYRRRAPTTCTRPSARSSPSRRRVKASGPLLARFSRPSGGARSSRLPLLSGRCPGTSCGLSPCAAAQIPRPRCIHLNGRRGSARPRPRLQVYLVETRRRSV